MFAALLTVFLFAGSAVSGERAGHYWGSQRGNLLRLALAASLMLPVSLIFYRDSLHSATFAWLFLSGVAGFGLGDIALFAAYQRIGARLTILLNLCTAPLWSALAEWLWLGTTIGWNAGAAAGLILVGVAMAILSRESRPVPHHPICWSGIWCGLAAGCGQGLGAVISRKALDLADAGGFTIEGFSAATQRITGGLITTALIAFTLHLFRRGSVNSQALPKTARPIAVTWLVATTLCGPVLGVSCFQWALASQPAGIITAVVATTPIAMIPLQACMGERPKLLSMLGALVAVVGVLCLLKALGTW